MNASRQSLERGERSSPPGPTPSEFFLRPIGYWGQAALGLLCIAALGLGGLVELRSAFLQRRMTDLDVYLRAAWAVRSGADLYTITDDNGWHYHYPPLLAILLVPLADAPAGVDRTTLLPFGVSVAFWYAFSLLCLVVAVHWLTKTLQKVSPTYGLGDLPPRSRGWWLVRVLPVVACLAPIGHTLMRGQVNLLLLLLLVGVIASGLRKHSWQAGGWLAGSICLKVIPAYLLIYPLWRRDWRCLAGCALGLTIGLGLFPGLVFGPTRTVAYYREWDEVLRRPALAGGADQSRAKELVEVTATDSQSFLAILHNLRHWQRATRPNMASAATYHSHWLIGGCLTLAVLLAGGWRRALRPSAELLFFGLLCLLMILLSPVCHLHYFGICVLILTAMTWQALENGGQARTWARLLPLMGCFLFASLLPHFPGLEPLRDAGLAMFGSLVVWFAGLVILARQPRQPEPIGTTSLELASRAA